MFLYIQDNIGIGLKQTSVQCCCFRCKKQASPSTAPDSCFPPKTNRKFSPAGRTIFAITTDLMPMVWLQTKVYARRAQICGCVSPLWSTTAAACLHLAAGGAPVHIMFSIWSLTVFPSVGPTGSGEINGSTARRTRALTGLRGEERPPNTTISPPGKEVAVW